MGKCENELRESHTPANVAEVLLVANMIRECDITLYVIYIASRNHLIL